MKKYAVYSWMVNCVSEKFCLWQSTTISMRTNTKCLFVRSNHFYSTFKLSQHSFCLTHVFTPKYSIFFCWVRFLVLLQYSTIYQTTETIFCWMLIFSFHCQSDASFFCQNNLPIYQNLFTGWPLWKDKADTWGNKTCLQPTQTQKENTTIYYNKLLKMKVNTCFQGNCQNKRGIGGTPQRLTETRGHISEHFKSIQIIIDKSSIFWTVGLS